MPQPMRVAIGWKILAIALMLNHMATLIVFRGAGATVVAWADGTIWGFAAGGGLLYALGVRSHVPAFWRLVSAAFAIASAAEFGRGLARIARHDITTGLQLFGAIAAVATILTTQSFIWTGVRRLAAGARPADEGTAAPA